MAEHERVYVIDSSALINLFGRGDDGAGWMHFVELVKQDRIKTVQNVLDELGRRFSEVFDAVKPYRSRMLVEQYVEPIWGYVGEIADAYPQLYKQLSNRNNSADPWLIAAARAHGFKIVTDERESGPEYTHRIPYVARQYGVQTCGSPAFLTDTGFTDRSCE